MDYMEIKHISDDDPVRFQFSLRDYVDNMQANGHKLKTVSHAVGPGFQSRGVFSAVLVFVCDVEC